MRRGAPGGGDLLEDPPAHARRRREATRPEGAVARDGGRVDLAPGDDGVLDGALLQMIEHLIAGEPARPGDAEGLIELPGVEVADAPEADLALLNQPLEGADRLFEGMGSGPVQQVDVRGGGGRSPRTPCAGARGA